MEEVEAAVDPQTALEKLGGWFAGRVDWVCGAHG